MKLIESIKKYEGFNGMPYKDETGNLTIGYGTKLPITEIEAEYLLVHRLTNIIVEMESKCKVYKKLSLEVKAILNNMAYNMGVPNICTFKKMWKALEQTDYSKAADEMLDSKWAREVGYRAIELAEMMRNIKG